MIIYVAYPFFILLLRMKKLLLLFILSAFIFPVALAQDFVLKGRVADAETPEEGLPSATAALFGNDTVMVAGTSTGNDGSFVLRVKKEGTYRLQISFVGYAQLAMNVQLKSGDRSVELGTLLLRKDEKLLKELQVTGLAQELTIKADTFVYHANAFRVPEGSTIAALIKQLPGLSMDSDGNLTFQGKAVSSILVNGKPFIGDANTAMSNIVSEAVQDVAVYEKTDEEKEFAGVHDAEKATVVDLKIKEEYMSMWNMNASIGGGTHSRYMTKAFASNFTERCRTAVYAQLNNISEDQVVDENGNWQNNSWSSFGGLYTYRKAGATISLDNGKGNTAGGYMKFDAEVELGHDSDNQDHITNVEEILGNAGTHYRYSRTLSSGRSRDISLKGDFTYNIDSLNRLSATLQYNYADSRNGTAQNSSLYSAAVNIAAPQLGLVGEEVSDELKALGINSTSAQGFNSWRRNDFTVDTRYVHRFKKEGYSFNVRVRYNVIGRRALYDALSCYRYFKVETPLAVERNYNVAPNDESELTMKAVLDGAFNKNILFSLSYRFSRARADEATALYRLDRYPYYSHSGLPVGVRPSTADSLAAVKDIFNSFYSQSTRNVHESNLHLQFLWDSFEATIGGDIYYIDEELRYNRGEVSYTPSRGYFDYTPQARLKWKPVKNGEISLSYYGYRHRIPLLDLLPVTDTSDQMVEFVNNPHLKDQWNNHFNLYSRWFNEKRGDSYSLYANYGIYRNSVEDIITTDPLTGKMRHTQENVNGCYYLSLGVNTEQPLDTERCWTLSAGAGYHINRNKSFIGAMGEEPRLSVIYSHSPRANMRLRWRSGMWSVNLSGDYSAEITRYDNTPEYNQYGHTIECSLQPQVDLPFGMKINTSFGFYGRRGYDNDIMNHDQWLLNATISQLLLKNKALTMQLEVVDLLHQRTSEFSYMTPQMRYFGKMKAFYSYVMLHAIYRFNIGGK